MKIILFCLSVLLLGTACNRKTGPRADDGATELPPRRVRLAQVLRGLEDQRVTAEWLEAKARIDLDSEKLTIGGNATVRIHRDEAIWISVRKFGFEGARALIRPDSFFVHNRLEGEYTAEPLSYVEEKYNLPARFDLLQEIFYGNAVFLTDDLELDFSEGMFRISGRDRRYATQHEVVPTGYELRSMEITDLSENRYLIVRNDDYQDIAGVGAPFATVREIQISDPEEGEARVEMEFQDVSVGRELAMPF